MKVIKTFLGGCHWCNARGFVNNPNLGLVVNITITCPVCNGSKTVLHTIEYEDPANVLTSVDLRKIDKDVRHG